MQRVGCLHGRNGTGRIRLQRALRRSSVRVFVDCLAGGIADPDGVADESKTIDAEADLIGIVPGLPPVSGDTRKASLEIAVAPAADPAGVSIDESDAFEIGVPLPIVQRNPPPRPA